MPKISKIKGNIITLAGKANYKQGEMFKISYKTNGYVLKASINEAQLLAIGDPSSIKINTLVTKVKNKTDNIDIYDSYFGKIISPFGEILHGPTTKKKAKKLGSSSLNNESPKVLERTKLVKPLHTGILAIDTMIPIGKGQRELIIGDRSTGKTAITLSTIISQKDSNTKVIYVSIGQKRNSNIFIYNSLLEHKALDNAIIMFANPDSSAEQYLAPKIGMAMAEALAYKGEDVLIIFDDLTKHANVYREIALSIGKSPGREAYPTDIFYEHSSLLERAGKFDSKRNNGSITALPIVETVQGDIASIIPSNIISITDGQIFTNTEQFNNGNYPAIDIALSVSRTGSSVQSPRIKEASKSLKADYAKLSEIKKFSEMAIDVTPELGKKIEQWEGIKNLIIQYGYKGYTEELTILLIELYKNGALGRLIEPKNFILILKGFISQSEIAQNAIKAIQDKKIEYKKLQKIIKTLFVPLAKAASGIYGDVFSSQEIEAFKVKGAI